jgi:hypothetical protein
MALSDAQNVRFTLNTSALYVHLTNSMAANEIYVTSNMAANEVNPSGNSNQRNVRVVNPQDVPAEFRRFLPR